MTIKLFFADKIMAREYVDSDLEFKKVHALKLSTPPFTLDVFMFSSFGSKLFSQWWSDWKKHLLNRLANHYCQLLDVDFTGFDAHEEPPMIDRSANRLSMIHTLPRLS